MKSTLLPSLMEKYSDSQIASRTSGRFVFILCETEVVQIPEQLYSWAIATSFQMRRNSETDCHCLTSVAVGAVYLLSCACLYVVVTVELNNTKNLTCTSPVQLLQDFHCDEQNLVVFIFHLSSHSSSLLSLIVSIWLERLPLSTVLMGRFHGGLRLEWIDKGRSPCGGQFASCVQAHRCCSSSYSSSHQVTGKSWLQLHSPHCSQLLRCGFVHPAAVWLYKTHSPYFSCIIPWKCCHTCITGWFSTVQLQCFDQGCG